MKKNITKTYIYYLFIVLFMLFFNVVLLKNNTYSIDETVSRFGEAIYIENNDSIDLVNENVYIEVKTGDVTCTYDLKNVTGVKRLIKMKFPGKITYKNNDEIKKIDIKNLVVYIDKTKVTIDKEKIQGSEYDYWYVWSSEFEPGITKKIMITYESIWERDYLDGITVGFIRTKGGPWINDLGYSKITFDFDNLKDYFIINSLDNGIYKLVDEKYIWEAKEYVPNEDLVLYMKPKLLESKKLNVSYYENTKALTGRKVLIDIDENYTNTQEEKDIKTKAAIDLKWRLEESGAEVCVSTDLTSYERSYSGQLQFDYIITLICDKSNNAEKTKAYVAYEQVEKGNEEKYRRSTEIAKRIINCNLDGYENVFPNLKRDNTDNSLLEDYGTINLNEAYDYQVPRVIISLGYTSDYTQEYKNYETILEKIRLGLSIYEECLSEDELKEFLKEEEKTYYQRQEEERYKGLTKFGVFIRYNLPSILICLLLGAVIGVITFSAIIANEQRKNRERYAMWYKKIK